MSRVTRFAGWLAATNLGVTFGLVAAIGGWAEWWCAPLAILGISLVASGITGLLVETRRIVADRSRRPASIHGPAPPATSGGRIPPRPQAQTRKETYAAPSRLVAVRMDLEKRYAKAPRPKAHPPARR
jgi:hypothetical protein